MKSKFIKVGTSSAIIIPSTDLKRLGIDSKDIKKYSFDYKINEDNQTITLSDFRKEENE